jgi:outer membrane protein assembly factor BamB
VVDGIVYIGSNDKNLYALNAADGTERWRFTTGKGGGVWSSPAVVDGVIYVGSYDRNLYALNAADGTERWRFATADDGFSFSPAVVDDVVYIGNGDLRHMKGDLLHAINTADGTERWRVTTGDTIWSSPAMVDGVVYVVIGDWQEDTGAILALNAADGTERWRFALSGFYSSSVAVADRVVYVGGAGIYALDTEDGSERWRVVIGDPGWSSPAVVDGVVYLGTLGGELYAIGARAPRIEVGGTARVTLATTLRGGPAPTAVARAELDPDTVVMITGEAEMAGDATWWPVMVEDTGDQGWVEESKLEPRTSGGDSKEVILPTAIA